MSMPAWDATESYIINIINELKRQTSKWKKFNFDASITSYLTGYSAGVVVPRNDDFFGGIRS